MSTPTARPPVPLYRAIAGAVIAYQNCVKSNNDQWRVLHAERAHKLVKDYMPSGSGIDSGTTLDIDASTEEKLVFETAFHHMDDSGGYAGWTGHTVTVRASLYFVLHISISGRDRNEIKDVLHERFYDALTAQVAEYPEVQS